MCGALFKCRSCAGPQQQLVACLHVGMEAENKHLSHLCKLWVTVDDLHYFVEMTRTSESRQWCPFPQESVGDWRKDESSECFQHWLLTGRPFGHKISAPITPHGTTFFPPLLCPSCHSEKDMVLKRMWIFWSVLRGYPGLEQMERESQGQLVNQFTWKDGH